MPLSHKKVEKRLAGSEIHFAYDKRNKLSQTFGVKAIPNLWILDRSGAIIFHKTGYSERFLPKLVDVVNAAMMD